MIGGVSYNPESRLGLRIVGIMAVYNESDIIAQVIEHLISQGIHLVIIDDGSTDGSYEICSEFLGRGVLSIGRLSNKNCEWEKILRKLYETALEYRPDWILLNDADEFYESPYHGLTLKEAIELEDQKGHNLIQFSQFEFWPTEKDRDSLDRDVRKRLRYYSWQDDFRFRCWKVYPGITIHEDGAHFPRFPKGERVKVSPTKFVLRHYKIRSYEHGLRKVFDERLPRYSAHELRKGWHVHYGNVGRDQSYFIIDSSKLTRYDDDGNWNLRRTFDGSFGVPWHGQVPWRQKYNSIESFISLLRSLKRRWRKWLP